MLNHVRYLICYSLSVFIIEESAAPVKETDGASDTALLLAADQCRLHLEDLRHRISKTGKNGNAGRILASGR